MQLDAMTVIDISPVINAKMAVFPGDTPFQRKIALDFKNGDGLGLSSVETTVHLGAHTDAPNHYAADGVGISERRLDFYLGSAQVLAVRLRPGGRILPEDLKDKKIMAPRVLFKTLSYPDPYRWNSDFMSLSEELVEFLAGRGVRLVGIDTPSIDLAEDKILQSHKAVARNDMAILEGIVLKDVAEGLYQLVALPLPLEGVDASPVRAILLK